ncbi:MAG: type II toxin-antitoxin system Phd/YefM family antitoxin [Hormoscilla sp.]
MVTITVDVNKVEMGLKELLSLVREGTEIVLTEDNIPRARLEAIASQTGPRIAGLHLGEIWTSDDFDRPLPDELWTGGA